MKHNIGYESKVGMVMTTLWWSIVLCGIVYIANEMGVNLIAMAQGYLGMVLLVSPNWDGFDSPDDWEMIEWTRCPKCGEFIETTDEYFAVAEHMSFDCKANEMEV